MSKAQSRSITCPDCGHVQDVAVWASVNVTVDKRLKRRLLKDRINVFLCAMCGCQQEVAADLLYHDMEQAYMIWLKYPDREGVIHLEGPALKLAKLIGRGRYTLRVVRSRNELKEKILILDASLDDRVVEVLKILISQKLGFPDPIPQDRLFFAELDRDQLVFAHLEDPESVVPIEIPLQEGYHGVVRQLQRELVLDDAKAGREWRPIGHEAGLILAERFIRRVKDANGI